MKRTSQILAGLALLIPLAAQAQFKYALTNGLLYYAVTNGTITITAFITAYDGPGGVVAIPSAINGVPVTGIGALAVLSNPYALFLGYPSISVAIPVSVTNIATGAITGITGVEGITVDPQNPSYSSVNGVLFNKRQTALIQSSSLGGAYVIPDGVTNIEDGAFGGCYLTNVVIPEGVTRIGNGAFEGNPLTTLAIPASVTSIGANAFAGCEGLSNIDLPDGVACIGAGAFWGTSLTNITIPASVTNIGLFGLSGGPNWNYLSLTNITVSPGNAVYSSVNGVLFDKSQTTLIQYPVGAAGVYAIPEGVVAIGDGAFESCENLTSITIPASVTNIGANAFYLSGVSNITVAAGNAFYSSVNGVLFDKSQATLLQMPMGRAGTGGAYAVPSGVTRIGDYSFEDLTATALTREEPGTLVITIPNSVTNIGQFAFYNAGLTSVTIGAGVTCIGAGAFQGSGLTSVAIPASVTNIGDAAFAVSVSDFGDSGLTNITVSPQNAFYSSIDGVLFDKSQTTMIQYPPGRRGNYTIPEGVTSIGDALENCFYLSGVAIPASITNIGASAFDLAWATWMNALGYASITNIDASAFDGDYLTNITVAAENTFYSSVNGVLFNKSQTTLIQYPVNAARAYSYTVPNGVLNIGDAAFAYESSLTNVTIPASVTSIGDGAFFGSASGWAFSGSSLASFCFRGNAPAVGAGAFDWAPVQWASGPLDATAYYLPGTTGWDSFATNTGLATALWNPVIQTGDGNFGVRGNQFGFNITGATNLPVLVEASTSLANPTWFPLQTLTLTNGSVYFSEPLQTNAPNRFYRLNFP